MVFMKYCQNCGFEYDDKFSFCQKCGGKLVVKEEKCKCSNCGEELTMESDFCPYCGTKIEISKTSINDPIVPNNDVVNKEKSVKTSESNITDVTDFLKKGLEDNNTVVNKPTVNKNSLEEPVKSTANEKKNEVPVKKIVVCALAVLIVAFTYVYDKASKDEKFKYQLYDMGFLRFLSAEEQFSYAYKMSEDQEYEKAYTWYKISAENGYAPSQNNLGVLYSKGRGVEKNEKEAFKWYLKAAKQGDDVAQCNVGRIYFYGIGTDKDTDEARKWLRKATAQGNKEAEVLLKLAIAIEDFGKK